MIQDILLDRKAHKMINQITIKIKKLFEDAVVPDRSFETDSGLDLYAHTFERHYRANDPEPDPIDVDSNTLVLQPGDRALVNSGVSATVGRGFEIQIRPRSGLALKKGLTVLNTPGTIDESYRGMLGIIIINHTQNPVEICKGMKIAQAVVCPVILCDVEVVDDLDKTDRGTGGFGHTDQKAEV
jgi:dUTP pyrophosphatase